MAGPVAAEEAEEADARPETKPKRELPAWVHSIEWTAIGVLGTVALIALVVAVFWIQSPDTVSLVLNISCPVMMALVPYALWRSSKRWMTPSTTALYTLLLAASVVALIGGTWVQGVELSHYNWQFTKARVMAGKPQPKFFAPPPIAAPSVAAPAADPAAPAK